MVKILDYFLNHNEILFLGDVCDLNLIHSKKKENYYQFDIQLSDGFYKPNLIVNSNDVEINIFKNTNSGQLIISANFDNLGKGASAAAIQCMNLRFGFDEILGL